MTAASVIQATITISAPRQRGQINGYGEVAEGAMGDEITDRIPDEAPSHPEQAQVSARHDLAQTPWAQRHRVGFVRGAMGTFFGGLRHPRTKLRARAEDEGAHAYFFLAWTLLCVLPVSVVQVLVIADQQSDGGVFDVDIEEPILFIGGVVLQFLLIPISVWIFQASLSAALAITGVDEGSGPKARNLSWYLVTILMTFYAWTLLFILTVDGISSRHFMNSAVFQVPMFGITGFPLFVLARAWILGISATFGVTKVRAVAVLLLAAPIYVLIQGLIVLAIGLLWRSCPYVPAG